MSAAAVDPADDFLDPADDFHPGECFAEGCTASIPSSMLMCRPHWYSVPGPVRNEVWAALREAGPLSERWWTAVLAARAEAAR